MPPDLPPVPRQALLHQQVFRNDCIPTAAHPGLVFDRYFRLWNRLGEPVEKTNFALQQFVQEYNNLGTRPTHSDRLAEYHTRLDALVSSYQGITREFETQSRLTIGLGADHPLENGFTFDYALGVAYLPGTSIKGLCRAWATLLVEQGMLAATEVADLLGVGPDDGRSPGVETRRGTLVFLPAYPRDWPKLAIDVMTTHHAEYYSADPWQRGPRRRVEPMDIESPTPIHFLTVQERTRFVLRILSRTSEVEAQKGFAWLEESLATLGIGAKTAVGYGVMHPAIR